MSEPMRQASAAEVAAVSRTLGEENVLPGPWSLEEMWERAPWSVRVSERGEVALVAAWREHMDILGIWGLWCADERIRDLVPALGDVARERSFGRLMSPLVPAERGEWFASAGMRLAHRIVPMYGRAARRHGPALSGEWCVCPASGEDVEGARRVDEESFDGFWKMDDLLWEGSLRSGRLSVARTGDRVIGYAVCTCEAGHGIVGRLAVAPEHRRRGVGRALLHEALAHLAARGARWVTLSTQEENVASIRLYEEAGFSRSSERLVLMVSDTL